MSDQDFDSTQKNLWFDPEKARLFGSMLTSAREVSGISIERLAEITRIGLTFLQCLESGEFSGLPGAVFGRGFLRSICKAINADTPDVIAAFEQALKVGSQANGKSLNVSVETGATNVRLRSELSFDHPVIRGLRFAASQISQIPFGIIGAAVLAAGVIPGVLWILGKPSAPNQTSESSHKTSETADVRLPGAIPIEEIEAAAQASEAEAAQAATETAATEQATTTEANVEAPKQNLAVTEPVSDAQKVESISVTAEAVPAKAATEAVSSATASAKQKLDVSVQASVKLRINLDNGSWESKQLEPGSYTFEFEKTAQILVFDAAAVDVKFNGKPLGALGAKGRVRRLSFAAQRTGNLEVPKRL
jgi:cytoskeleton protein RodZ